MCVRLFVVVADNGLGDEGMVALAPALGKLAALTSLDLSGTWLGMRRMGGVRGPVVTLLHWWSCVCVAVGGGCRGQIWCRGHSGTGGGVEQVDGADVTDAVVYVAGHTAVGRVPAYTHCIAGLCCVRGAGVAIVHSGNVLALWLCACLAVDDGCRQQAWC